MSTLLGSSSSLSPTRARDRVSSSGGEVMADDDETLGGGDSPEEYGSRSKLCNPSHRDTLSRYMMHSYDNGNNLTDVTVHCEDHTFHAHRIVLGHYSEFFRALFENLSGVVNHFDVFLEGFSVREIEVVLLFMYTGGVVCCDGETLGVFTNVATALHIPSLSDFLLSPEEASYPDNLPEDEEDEVSSPVGVWEKCVSETDLEARNGEEEECAPNGELIDEDDDQDVTQHNNIHHDEDDEDDALDPAVRKSDSDKEVNNVKKLEGMNASCRSRKQARPQRHTATPSPPASRSVSPTGSLSSVHGGHHHHSTSSEEQEYYDDDLLDDEDDILEDDDERSVEPLEPQSKGSPSSKQPDNNRVGEHGIIEALLPRRSDYGHVGERHGPIPGLPPPQYLFLRNMMNQQNNNNNNNNSGSSPGASSGVPPPPPPPNAQAPPPPGPPHFFGPPPFCVPPVGHPHHPHHHQHHPLQGQLPGQPQVTQQKRILKDKVLWGKIMKHQHFHASSRAQHSAPRGGPPRAWSNQDLTEALHNVWNKKMTTSQASRIFGIPYNSLLMYVRGKYGKSLKLDLLKKGLDLALLEKQQKLHQQNSKNAESAGGGVHQNKQKSNTTTTTTTTQNNNNTTTTTSTTPGTTTTMPSNNSTSTTPTGLHHHHHHPQQHHHHPHAIQKQNVVEWMMMSSGGGGGGFSPSGKISSSNNPHHHHHFHPHFLGFGGGGGLEGQALLRK